jgi:F420H(2)-dependent quinone reductase
MLRHAGPPPEACRPAEAGRDAGCQAPIRPPDARFPDQGRAVAVPGWPAQRPGTTAQPGLGHRPRDRAVAAALRDAGGAGRRTGRLLSFPLVRADYGGERYLVSMLGEHSNWLRNVRAAGGRAVLRHGRREAVRLEEVDPDARAPIVRRYLSLAPGPRAFIPVDRDAPLEEFEKVAPQVPVFRVRGDREAHRAAEITQEET